MINNIRISLSDNKYNLTNIAKFVKKDFEFLCNASDREITAALIEAGLLTESKTCVDCGTVLTTIHYEDNRHPYFRCTKRNCRRAKMSLFKNTIFDGMKITLKEVLNLLYAFACRRSVGDSSETLDLSKHTVMSFYALFRASVMCFLDKYSCKMGGPGVVVHFDETPITSRHGNTGRFMPSNTV